MNNTLKGLGLFQLEVVHLISIGKKESIKAVENSIENGELIEYIFNKYEKDFDVFFLENSSYDNKELNQYFNNYSGYVCGNESRKYGVVNDDDGLLLIIALISEILEYHSIHMTANDNISG